MTSDTSGQSQLQSPAATVQTDSSGCTGDPDMVARSPRAVHSSGLCHRRGERSGRKQSHDGSLAIIDHCGDAWQRNGLERLI